MLKALGNFMKAVGFLLAAGILFALMGAIAYASVIVTTVGGIALVLYLIYVAIREW